MELSEWRAGARSIATAGGVLSRPSQDVVVEYLTWLDDHRGRQASTVRSYQQTLAHWLDWLGGTHVANATLEQMQAFLQRERVRRGRGKVGAPATRRREASSLRAFYQWMEDMGYVVPSPARMLHGPTVRGRNPRPIDDDNWLRVWGADLTVGERAFLGLGFFCGLRRAEIAALRADQVTQTRITDFIRKGGGEHTLPWAEMVGVHEDRLAHLKPELFSPALLALARNEADTLLPWVMNDPLALNRRLTAIQRRLEIPERERFTPHQLRHSCATNLLRAGVPLHLVASLLNHSNVSITMTYVKAGGNELRQWRAAQ